MLTYILVSFLFSFKKWFGLRLKIGLWIGWVLGLGLGFGIGNLIGGAAGTVDPCARKRPVCRECTDGCVELASHALVVMILGLTTNWKQVLAYYLTGNSVNGNVLWHMLKQIVVDLQTVEVNVRAAVCDIGSCNRAMWRVAGVVACKQRVVNSVQHLVLLHQLLYLLPEVLMFCSQSCCLHLLSHSICQDQ